MIYPALSQYINTIASENHDNSEDEEEDDDDGDDDDEEETVFSETFSALATNVLALF